MKVLGIRFCSVSGNAEPFARFLDGLGIARMDLEGFTADAEEFSGAIFPAGDSWVEIWPEGPDMPECIMLQVVVDDADAFAAHACENGIEPEGPVDHHGERISYVQSPSGLQMSVQSQLPGGDG